jgi:hypothetical protein
MRLRNRAFLMGMAAPLLVGFVTGCANFWQAPTSTGTTTACTTNCTTASSGSFYVLNAGTTPEVIGESFVSGQLAGITGSPWVLQATPYAMAIEPTNGSFLAISTTSGVFAYPLTSGALGTGTVVSTDQAYAVLVDATSTWLIEAIPGTGGVTIGAIPINSTTGATNGTEQTVSFAVANAAVQAGKMVLSGDNANIFISLGAGGTLIVPFDAAVTAGANPLGTKATTIAVANVAGSALCVAVDPGATPRLFYIGETLANSGNTSGGLRVFNYSSLGSTLTQATGSPLASGGLAPNAILPIASGSYVYVANGQGTTATGNITGFSITAGTASPVTYSLASVSSAATGIQPLALAEDSTSAFVLEVGALGSPYFDSFTFDTITPGKLDTQVASSTAASYTSIVATP